MRLAIASSWSVGAVYWARRRSTCLLGSSSASPEKPAGVREPAGRDFAGEHLPHCLGGHGDVAEQADLADVDEPVGPEPLLLLEHLESPPADGDRCALLHDEGGDDLVALPAETWNAIRTHV
jgi:hypothetical protein